MVAVLLIRHAHAGSRRDWQSDDRLRPLTPKGQRQATLLARRLKPWAAHRILSSPYVRCVQTVEPLAESLGLKIEEVDELAEGAGTAALKLIRSLASSDVAFCTHGDITATVLTSIAKEDRLNFGRRLRHAKGSTWV